MKIVKITRLHGLQKFYTSLTVRILIVEDLLSRTNSGHM